MWSSHPLFTFFLSSHPPFSLVLLVPFFPSAPPLLFLSPLPLSSSVSLHFFFILRRITKKPLLRNYPSFSPPLLHLPRSALFLLLILPSSLLPPLDITYSPPTAFHLLSFPSTSPPLFHSSSSYPPLSHPSSSVSSYICFICNPSSSPLLLIFLSPHFFFILTKKLLLENYILIMFFVRRENGDQD